MSLSEHVVHDYCATSLSLKGHPVSFHPGEAFAPSYNIGKGFNKNEAWGDNKSSWLGADQAASRYGRWGLFYNP